MNNMHRSLLAKASSRVVPGNKTLPKRLQLKKWKITAGDKVMIISGKDRGETGTVSEVSRKTNSLYVRGRKLGYKHIPQTHGSESRRVQREMPIHVSNVALLDPSTGRPTKVRFEKHLNTHTGKSQRQRYAVGTDTLIPRNPDLSYQKKWADGKLDTDVGAVNHVSFQAVPGVPPFPMDLVREIKNRLKRHY
ncbi:hypothetical protein GGF46_001615 [Coemansia sp. RSA 552]|nr:hypothetical protein GGF46_001615 [Coemansia sp. RSA 552]